MDLASLEEAELIPESWIASQGGSWQIKIPLLAMRINLKNFKTKQNITALDLIKIPGRQTQS